LVLISSQFDAITFGKRRLCPAAEAFREWNFDTEAGSIGLALVVSATIQINRAAIGILNAWGCHWLGRSTIRGIRTTI
jgi:hypothetical protein